MFGEWYLARDSESKIVIAYPAEFTEIRKYRGCTFYAPTRDLDTYPGRGMEGSAWGLHLRPTMCKKMFGYTPADGKLLRVIKTRCGWKSEKIDLEFTFVV